VDLPRLVVLTRKAILTRGWNTQILRGTATLAPFQVAQSATRDLGLSATGGADGTARDSES
jgi:hypothetical protein